MKDVLSAVPKKSFFKSDWYLALIVLLVLTLWYFELPLVGVGIFVILILIMLVTKSNLLGFFPLFATATFLFHDQHLPASTPYLVAIGAAIVLAIVMGTIYVVKNKSLKITPPFIGALILFAAAVVAGSLNGHFGSIPWLVGIGITGIIAVALLFLPSLFDEYDPRFFAKIFVAMQIIVTVQIFVYLFRQEDIIFSLFHKDMNLGWGVSNNGAMVLVMTMPFSLYLAAKSKFPVLYIGLFFLSFAAVFATLSRGCILALAIFTVPLLATTVRLSKKRVLTALSILLFTAALIVLFYYLKDELWTIIEKLKNKGLDENGRIGLWTKAYHYFMESDKLFGAGFGYGSALNVDSVYIFFYHNTYIQSLVYFGIIGFVAFLFHIGQRFYYLLKKKSKFKLFAFWGCVLAGFYGLMDVTYFMPYFLMPMMLILVMAEKGKNITPDADEELM